MDSTKVLQQIADNLRVMLASSTELHDGIGDVTGYQIKALRNNLLK